MARQHALQRQAPRFDSIHGGGRSERQPHGHFASHERTEPLLERAIADGSGHTDQMSEREGGARIERWERIRDRLVDGNSGKRRQVLCPRAGSCENDERDASRDNCRSQTHLHARKRAAPPHRDACRAGTSDSAPKSPADRMAASRSRKPLRQK